MSCTMLFGYPLMKLVLPDSQYYVTDPDFHNIPVDELLSKVMNSLSEEGTICFSSLLFRRSISRQERSYLIQRKLIRRLFM